MDLLLFFSCVEKPKPSAGFTDQMIDLVIKESNNEGIEFTNLYDKLVFEIATDELETVKLAEKLKRRGFRQTNWGRGNHALGPRLVSVTLVNENCQCEVAKIYYSTHQTDVYQITERIRCEMVAK
ncbi:MAG: hypothetical protein EAY81_08375 [Bacteroidetes bacterium]|nr:MAG: hypothetical protein EAY81_08375 [Bacteroidota bacterium]